MKKAHLRKYRSDVPKVRSHSDTPRAKILAEEKLGGAGATVLYRQRNNTAGVVQHREVFADPYIKHAEELLNTKFFAYYRNVPVDKRPPVVEAIRRRIEVKLEILNQRRTALEEWHHYKVIDEVYRQLVCFFSGRKAFFVEHDEIAMQVKMSRDYDTDRAREIVQRKLFNRIVWFQVDTIPDTT